MSGLTAALTGRLGSDADLRHPASGSPFLAVNTADDDQRRRRGWSAVSQGRARWP
jgi:hypothetical protein